MQIDSEISINGDWPKLEGKILQEMLCHEMYYEGRLEELANVIYVKIDEKWLRLYFDYEIIFWRNESCAPKEYSMPETSSYFKLTDVANKFSFKGNTIDGVSAKTIEDGVEVGFYFNTGKKIIFSSINDASSYRT
jgi:hypothetical protein